MGDVITSVGEVVAGFHAVLGEQAAVRQRIAQARQHAERGSAHLAEVGGSHELLRLSAAKFLEGQKRFDEAEKHFEASARAIEAYIVEIGGSLSPPTPPSTSASSASEPPESGPVRLTRLSGSEAAAFWAYRGRLARDGQTRPAVGTGPEAAYQRRVCGDTEFRLTSDEVLPRAAWADGLNMGLGLAQDSKYVKNPESSFYNPASLSPKVRKFAEKDLDDRLLKYKEAINDPSNPVRGLEIITNDPAAAQHISARMSALGVPGIVVVQE